MVRETFASVRSQIHERATSPLLGAFLLSWSIWNYKFFIILFSDLSAPEKIGFYHLYYGGPAGLDYWLNLIVAPLGFTAFFIFIYPFPAKLVFQFWRTRQKELNELKKRIEKETLLTAEESISIRKRFYEKEKALRNEVEEKDDKIEGFSRGRCLILQRNMLLLNKETTSPIQPS